ncbi:MAG: hypothetical protein LBG19_10695 [Prevotellaceae bacterium]|jgi:hypothetical protein|nr:hypothetical protein [Prevotellaceae bacterium]
MKRRILLTLVILTALGTNASAQISKSLTSEDVQNLLTSTTYVVITNSNIVYDAVLSNAAKEVWTITPLQVEGYNFGNEDQSFLAVTRDVFEKKAEDNSYTFLTLFQGRRGARDIDNLPWVVSFPISVDDEDTEIDETLLIGLLVKSIQNHVELLKWEPSIAKKALEKLYNDNIGSLKGKTIYMLDEDINQSLDREKILNRFNGHLKLVGPDEIERLIKDKDKNAVIAYTVTGGYCYKLLIGVEDGKIYYYNRDKVNNSFLFPAGFLQSELNKLSSPFKR